MGMLMRMTTAPATRRVADYLRCAAFWGCVALAAYWIVDAGVVVKHNVHTSCTVATSK